MWWGLYVEFCFLSSPLLMISNSRTHLCYLTEKQKFLWRINATNKEPSTTMYPRDDKATKEVGGRKILTGLRNSTSDIKFLLHLQFWTFRGYFQIALYISIWRMWECIQEFTEHEHKRLHYRLFPILFHCCLYNMSLEEA